MTIHPVLFWFLLLSSALVWGWFLFAGARALWQLGQEIAYERAHRPKGKQRRKNRRRP